MISLTPENCLKIHSVFKHNKANNAPDIRELFELVNIMSTVHVCYDPLAFDVKYWEFMHACLEYLEHGFWTTLPRFWIDYCCCNSSSKLLLSQVEAEYKNYLKHRQDTLNKLGLCYYESSDKAVLLHWIQKPQGEQYLMAVAHALLRIYLFNIKLTLGGIITYGNKKVESMDESHDPNKYDSDTFGDENQLIQRLLGENKQQIVKNNLHKQFKRHEYMV